MAYLPLILKQKIKNPKLKRTRKKYCLSTGIQYKNVSNAKIFNTRGTTITCYYNSIKMQETSDVEQIHVIKERD